VTTRLYRGGDAFHAPWLQTISNKLHTERRVAIALEGIAFPHMPDAETVERDILRVFRQYRGDHDYTRAYRKGSRLDPFDIEIDEGATSILDVCRHNAVMLNICNLHREIPYLGETASMLSGALHANVRLDAFCSGPGMAATPIHYDYDNAFVMQLVGTKHWRCYDNLSEIHVHFGGYKVDEKMVGDKHFEKVMAYGDGIFIPGGTLHEAYTTRESSIHLAIDLSPITPDATVGYLIRSRLEHLLQRGEAFEAYTPEVAQTTLRLTREVVNAFRSDDVHEWHQRYLLWAAAKYQRVVPQPYRGYRDGLIKLAPGGWARLRSGEGSVEIDYQAYSKAIVTSLPWTFKPASVALPEAVRPILERIFSAREGVRIAELDENLSPDSTDILVKALIQIGLVEETA
jgi:Cupin superfamily protein